MKKIKTFSIDFILRKTKSDFSIGYLSAKITVNGRSIEFSLNEKIQISSWSSSHEKVIGKGIEVDSINNYIGDVRFRILESKRALESGRFEITCESIKDHYNNCHISQKPPESGHTLVELIDKHKKLECRGDNLKPGTTKNYDTTEKYLKNFLKDYFKKDDVDLLHLDYEALLELENHIRTKPLKKHDPCLGNGLYKHMERVGKMFGMAKKMKWIKDNPFDQYTKKPKKVSRENLKIHDFIKIERASFNDERLQFAKDLFVYDCYMGVSYIDLVGLEPKHFEGINGRLFCTVYRNKNTELCGIPVPDAAKEIMDQYASSSKAISSGKIFPYISNQELNRSLKIIAEILNIPLELDTRMARRFFAKEINLKNGVPMETVSKLLGHSKISTTKNNYADVDEEKILEDTADVQNKFSRKKSALR
ncbi:phage integrase SAM-like domain-containing protein [Danxiaibacter flavus]|uniref:Phage integrase SAM-like domain-containing protein n=1 Tax=Danxiaibacter flavus TaxID=3049108 RepID=A0ABV3ZLS6_9BACT|nr:phage integrase SAM-like domain-containing protein [Chitinophagaceae bacterium DXS]